MPYQCLSRSGNFLIAATNSHIDTFNTQNGSRVSRWSCCKSVNTENDISLNPEASASLKVEKSKSSLTDITAGSQPPTKKRRLSPETKEVSEKRSLKQKKVTKPGNMNALGGSVEVPNVIALASTKDGKHVIAVTGEDKTVRVFQHDGGGLLEQLSERAMLKRPCAIALTDDECTIVLADKFGDVYSIPVLFIPEHIHSMDAVTTSKVAAEPKPLNVAANLLTIHTERNRRTLENQLRQKNTAPERAEMKFEHQLLLGHVSMLTDVVLVYARGESYILTADRDEHIRISRGIPQSHIIHGFCLGHQEFVSRICVPKATPELLVSGGGDDELHLWHWRTGELLRKINLRTALIRKVVRRLQTVEDQESHPEKITVSGICDIGEHDSAAVVAIMCEGVPAILTLEVLPTGNLIPLQVLDLPGNPLAIEACRGLSDSIIISVDLVHEAGSTSLLRTTSEKANTAGLMTLTFCSGELKERSLMLETQEQDETRELSGVGLSSQLYSLGNLRKRGGEE